MSEELRAAIERKKQDILRQAKDYQECIARCFEDLTKVEDTLTPLYDLAARLRAAGFEPVVGVWADMVRVNVRRTQLTDVYRVVGRLKKEYTNLANARKKEVEVTLSAVDHPFLRVKYIHKLKPTDKCQIVRKKRVRVGHDLVCSLTPASS
jgi:hypothetical protein